MFYGRWLRRWSRARISSARFNSYLAVHLRLNHQISQRWLVGNCSRALPHSFYGSKFALAQVIKQQAHLFLVNSLCVVHFNSNPLYPPETEKREWWQLARFISHIIFNSLSCHHDEIIGIPTGPFVSPAFVYCDSFGLMSDLCSLTDARLHSDDQSWGLPTAYPCRWQDPSNGGLGQQHQSDWLEETEATGCSATSYWHGE